MKVSITITDERDFYDEGERKTETYNRVHVYDLEGNSTVVAGLLDSIVRDLRPEKTTVAAVDHRVVRGAM